MKKIFTSLVILLLVGALAGCSLFAPEEKEFSQNGMTVTLDESFTKSENVAVQMYLLSNDHIFTGNGESKSTLADYGHTNLTLHRYTELVLASVNKKATINTYDEDVTFKYAYYEANVEGTEFAYMLVTMEGDSKFYSMNFGCLKKNFNDDTKEKYMEWAKTIKVD